MAGKAFNNGHCDPLSDVREAKDRISGSTGQIPALYPLFMSIQGSLLFEDYERKIKQHARATNAEAALNMPHSKIAEMFPMLGWPAPAEKCDPPLEQLKRKAARAGLSVSEGPDGVTLTYRP